ncbi:MAG TPA: hypothetical protein VMX75_16240 [Spirochaetia bacterium]|nr:hypothetical protein [Spirochaetia bacterium]
MKTEFLRRGGVKSLLLVFLFAGCLSCMTSIDGDSPFSLAYDRDQYWITEVLTAYCSPGAGQHTNDETYAMTSANFQKLYGPPDGRGSNAPNANSVVSLHGPGAYITVRFSPPIEDHPDNIKGYDFIVFGNGFWSGGDPASHWQEPGTVEVMRDRNGNGIPDDGKWYLMPGSQFTALSTKTALESDRTDPSKYPINVGHSEWYPGPGLFPGFPDHIIHTFYKMEDSKVGQTGESVWGYADVTPVLKPGDMSGADGLEDNSLQDPEDDPDMDPVFFYTVPDTHGDMMIDPGSGGGDAFDIAWAVDPDTWGPANLDAVDFIRITNSCNKDPIDPVLLDFDTEIDAIARVRRH